MQYPNHQPAAGQQGQDVIPSFPAPPPPPLPPGWEQANDPASGRIYYANRATGETSWTPPLFPPMLQPPPPMQLVQQTNNDMYHQQQMMLASAPVAAVQPQQQIMMAQPDNMHNIPVNNVSMQSNYGIHQQQYVPNQPQVALHSTASSEPSNIIHSVMQPNSHVQTPQQLETQTQSRINSNTLSGGGLGPSTATSQGMLVPSIRAMINEEYTQRVNQQQAGSVQSPPPKLELEGLTAGAIADLCNVTRELKSRNNVDGGDFAEVGGGIDIVHKQQQGQEGDDDEEEGDQYYAPLQPFTLPVSAIPPHIEPGRVDIRLHALHTKLGKI